jgi:hypothetical protein
VLTTVCVAEQEADVPPFDPAQVQLHGPLPVTLEAVPKVQRLVVGIDDTVVPLADPQEPFTAVGVTGVTTNVAPTLLALLIVTTHVVVVAEHAPDQPVKVLPVTATAVSVTTVPEAIEEVQDEVQVVIPVPVMYPRPEVVVRERVLFVGVTTGRVAIVLPNDVAETLPALLLAVTVTVSVVPASCVEVA